MKISVNSTFSYIKFNLNYGSALQCFALQKYLIRRGHDVTLLRDYRANPIFILRRLKNIRYIKPFIQKLNAQMRLQKFIHKYIRLSKRKYFTYKSLVEHCPDADCHIVGSDQIWHNANNFRYLTYVPDEKLKLSYAASFGRSTITEDMKKIIKPFLGRFDGISVREALAVGVIHDMGYEAKHVLDPTLLLDSSEYPCSSNKNAKYCYCYFLNLKSKSDIPFDKIQAYAKLRKLNIAVTVPLNYKMFLGDNLIFPSVEEWIGLYKNAECIFTNTYHGLLFCIIFKKEFLFFVQCGDQAAENERFYSLLEMLGLTDRIVNSKDSIDMRLSSKIDYEYVYSIIYQKRKITDEFFENYGL